MLPDVFTLLASPAVKAIVGTNPARIYRHGKAPQTVAAPYITWFLVSATPENTLSETPAVDQDSVQVNLWGKNDGSKDAEDELSALTVLVRDLIETDHHVTSVFDDDLDATTERPRISFIYTDWKSR
jgi:hypothetical protein